MSEFHYTPCAWRFIKEIGAKEKRNKTETIFLNISSLPWFSSFSLTVLYMNRKVVQTKSLSFAEDLELKQERINNTNLRISISLYLQYIVPSLLNFTFLYHLH